MTKWHSNITAHEHLCNLRESEGFNYPFRRNETLESLVDNLKRLTDKQKYDNKPELLIPFHHVMFHGFGRPTYLVSKQVYEACKTLQLSHDDFSNAFERLPYWSFMFAFERGCALGNREISNIMISRDVRDKIDACAGESIAILFADRVDGKSGLKMITGPRTLTAGNFGDVPQPETFVDVRSVLASMMMLWRSRPHFLKHVTLPRSERYQFKGNRELLRQWVLPTELISRMYESTQITDGKWHVRPHWRAGHFRHYRHERYARNADGSVRVEFIEPCFVGDKGTEENK